MEHVEIVKNKVYLSRLQVPALPADAKTTVPTNHILIIDRSGSMAGTLDGVIDDLGRIVGKMKVDDTVTIGWFSGEGQWDWAIKGFRISQDKDYAVLQKALGTMRSTLGTTCFSEILGDVDNVIRGLSIFSDLYSLHLMTDGHPVVNNYKKEVSAIFEAIEAVRGRLASALLVGYGYYYNKALMASMAEKIGGCLVHASDLSHYSSTLGSFVNESTKVRKVAIDTGCDLDDQTVVFTINGAFVTSISPSPDGVVSVEPHSGYVYVLSGKPIGQQVALSDFTPACYAAAMLLSQRAEADRALDLIGAIGDKALADELYNSFSHEEYGRLEGKLLEAVQKPEVRFRSGRVSGCVPKADAFCLLDLLDLLHDSTFYPAHPDFRYSRIGARSETAEGYPKFVANPLSGTKVASLTWHDSKLNLSVLTKIDGTVDLLDKNGVTPESLGFSRRYPTSVWRNFAIVKDGNINVQSMPVSMPEETFDKLSSFGMLKGHAWEDGKVYNLRLDGIPIVNRSIANGRTSAKALCEKVLEEQKLKATLKALRWFRDRLPSTGEAHKLSEAQAAFLEANGIDAKGVFSPPSATTKTDDFYMTRTFEIKVSGLSSFPKVEDVLSRYEGAKKGTKATKSEQLVYAGVELYRSAGLDTMPDSVKGSWLAHAIEKATSDMKSIRRYVQETKFAVILGKKWFDEFATREGCELTLGDYKLSFQLSEHKVPV